MDPGCPEQPRVKQEAHDKAVPSGYPCTALAKFGEKLVGELLGRTVDQPLSELGQLAADLSFDIVAQQVPPSFSVSQTNGAALSEAGDAALAFNLKSCSRSADRDRSA